MWQLTSDCQGCKLKLIGLGNSSSPENLLLVTSKGVDWSCLGVGE